MSGGFVTDYLKDYGEPDDWECEEDGLYRKSDGYMSWPWDIINVTAWYSPSRDITAFGGMLGDIPDTKGRLSDPLGFAAKQECLYGWRIREADRRRQQAEEYSDWLDSEAERGWIRVCIVKDDGEELLINHTTGTNSQKKMRRLLSQYLAEHGGTVKKLEFWPGRTKQPTAKTKAPPLESSRNWCPSQKAPGPKRVFDLLEDAAYR
jgi:hypothetical protein